MKAPDETPRNNRVPVMMSNAEMDSIDEWQHENRIATRSEAIRRLCKIGLEAEAKKEQGK